MGDFFNDSDIRTIRCGEYVCDDKILYIFEAVQTNKFTLSLVSAKLYFVVFNIDNFRSILHQVRCWSFVPDFEIIKFLHPLHQAEISWQPALLLHVLQRCITWSYTSLLYGDCVVIFYRHLRNWKEGKVAAVDIIYGAHWKRLKILQSFMTAPELFAIDSKILCHSNLRRLVRPLKWTWKSVLFVIQSIVHLFGHLEFLFLSRQNKMDELIFQYMNWFLLFWTGK